MVMDHRSFRLAFLDGVTMAGADLVVEMVVDTLLQLLHRRTFSADLIIRRLSASWMALTTVCVMDSTLRTLLS